MRARGRSRRWRSRWRHVDATLPPNTEKAPAFGAEWSSPALGLGPGDRPAFGLDPCRVPAGGAASPALTEPLCTPLDAAPPGAPAATGRGDRDEALGLEPLAARPPGGTDPSALAELLRTPVGSEPPKEARAVDSKCDTRAATLTLLVSASVPARSRWA